MFNAASIQLSLESTSYTVSEDVGVVDVCAEITMGSTGNSSFEANFVILSQSALGKFDTQNLIVNTLLIKTTVAQ